MEIETNRLLPPQIIVNFNRDLLSGLCPKFCHDSENLHRIYKHILYLMKKKGHYSSGKVAKTEKLLKEYLELYERIKVKEKDEKAASKNGNPRLFYYFPSIAGQGQDVFQRLIYRPWNLQALPFD